MRIVFQTDPAINHLTSIFTVSLHILNLETHPQPRPQGLLAFQYGGGRREDPGTQQKSRDRFVHGEWKIIQNGGKDKE